MMSKKRQPPKRTITNLQVNDIVESEGLGYAITGYIGSEEFVDLELAALWDQANDILTKIQNKLDQAVEDDVGDQLG